MNRAIDNIERNIDSEQIYREKFDAILVDEGQDFNLTWWNTLRRLLKNNGEMLLVADETQDLYARAKNWTAEGMNAAGFKGGPWTQLDICYRTPDKLIDYLKVFAKTYIPESNIRSSVAESATLDLWPATLSWVQVSTAESLPQVCAEAILKMPEISNPDLVAYPDLILLMPNHRLGLSCVGTIEANRAEKYGNVGK